MKIKPSIAIAASAIVVILAISIPAIGYFRGQALKQKMFALIEINEGNVIGGDSQSDAEQILCFDKGDFSTINAQSDRDQKRRMVIHLFAQGRCQFSSPTSRFSVDADGRQVYVTRSNGTVALWAEKSPD